MKIWTSTEKGNERVIAHIDNTIYRGNPKLADIDSCVYDLKMKKVPADNFFGVDFHELKQVNLQDGKEYVEILFGRDSYEHFRITNNNIRTEVFNYFKTALPDFSYSVDKYSRIQAGKKPLIATAVVLDLFIWALVIAIGIEAGNEYDVTGGHYNSFAGIVLAFASLGIVKTILIFGSLLAVALFSLIRKMSNPPVIQRLTKTR